MGVLDKYIPFEKPWALLISMALHASLFVLPLAFLAGGQPVKERIITAHLLGEFRVTAAQIGSVKPASPIDVPPEENAGTESIARRSLSERPPVERSMAAEKATAAERAMAAEAEDIVQDRNETGINEVWPQLDRQAQLDTPEDDHAGPPSKVKTVAVKSTDEGIGERSGIDDPARGMVPAEVTGHVKERISAPAGDNGMLAIIRERIRDAQYYPPIARKRGWEGTSMVRFCINESGGVKSIEVVISSGITALDQATIKAVEKGTPYPPLAGWIQLPVSYQLMGSPLE